MNGLLIGQSIFLPGFAVRKRRYCGLHRCKSGKYPLFLRFAWISCPELCSRVGVHVSPQERLRQRAASRREVLR
jgi:hypothetical protein